MATPESNEDRYKRMKSSVAGYKSHLTREVGNAKRLAKVALNKPSQRLLKDVHKQLDTLTERKQKVDKALEDIRITFVPTDEINKYIDDNFEDTTASYEEGRDDLYAAEAHLEELFPPNVKQEVTHLDGNNDRPKVDATLKPFTLTDNHSPVEMRTWIKEFTAFYNSSHFERAEIEVQHSYFFKFISPDIRQRIENDISPNLPVLDQDDGCLGVLTKDFEIRYPTFNRRLDYFAVKQKGGQSALTFVKQLEAIGNEAALSHIGVEDLYIHRVLEGLTDKKLRNKLLKLPTKTRETFMDQINLYEAAKASSSRLDGSKTNSIKTRKYGKSKSKGDTKGKKSVEGRNKYITPITTIEKLKGKCMRCAKNNHSTKECYFFLKPEKVQCSNCGKNGHIAKACLGGSMSRPPSRAPSRSSSRASSPATSETSNDSNLIKVNKIGGKKVPLVEMLVRAKDKSGVPFKHYVLPDSGAMRTIIPYKLMKTYGLKYKNTLETIRAANNAILPCEGQVDLIIKYGDSKVKINALVSSGVSDFLISWYDLIELGILPKTFPEKIQPIHQLDKEEEEINAQKLQTMLEKFSDVFSDTLKKTPIKGKPVKIHLKDDAKPKRILTTRKIPAHHEEEAKRIIDQLIKDDVIAKLDTPTDWLSPAFFVPKESGGLRLVVDYSISGLNQNVKRNIHPFPSAADIMKSIKPTSKWFLKADATQGYHQVMLDEESQKLTAFILPFGCYYFKRTPMGLSPSGDEFCSRTDIAINEVTDSAKIVDDILLQAPTQAKLFDRLEELLKACRNHNITLSLKKLQIGQEIKFAGYIVSQHGIKPDPDKLAAIREFPTPHDVTSLKSFLGLANQLASFIPDMSHITTQLRMLLKKDMEFIWLPEHQKAFEEAKNILTSEMVVTPFDPSLKTELLTDASRKKGLGFALLQVDNDGQRKLIQCGSRSLTAAEKNYATIELECLGITYGVEKARHYLLGMNGFTILTDHRPLEGIFKKSLDAIDNTRLQRLRMKLASYKFDVVWTPGKTHLIADALSRAPVFDPPEDSSDSLENVNLCNAIASDPNLNQLHEAAKEDKNYQRIIQAIQDDKQQRILPTGHPAKLYANIWENISILNGLLVVNNKQIIIPDSQRKRILELLHIPHCGKAKTKQNARQLYYWPGMSNDIDMIVDKCIPCRELLPSQQKEPLKPTDPTHPMSHIGLDLAQEAGHTYLIMVDAYSGFPFCHKLKKTHTSAVTTQLEKWFYDFGFPSSCRSDGGPQFRSEFEEFCLKYDIKHSPSSPYFPQSNGLAENGVKTCKHLIKKYNSNWNDFKAALLEWRNTPRADGISPAQLFFGRRQRSHLPCLPEALAPINQREAANLRGEMRKKKKTSYDGRAKELPKLQVGQNVLLQNPISKKWDSMGKIKKIREDGRSYTVESNDSTYLRNRRHLRPLHTTDQHIETKPSIPKTPIIRRSDRLAAKQKKVSFNISN